MQKWVYIERDACLHVVPVSDGWLTLAHGRLCVVCMRWYV
jgi:hypothetical protein